MRKQAVVISIFILSQIVIQIFTIQTCMASDGNKGAFLSGSAWMDSNHNSIQELAEENIADVIIFVQNDETGKLVTTKTDSAGYYNITNLSYGRYTIWSESITGATTATQTIELDEVNGAAVVNPAFTPATAQVRIYLPIVNN